MKGRGSLYCERQFHVFSTFDVAGSCENLDELGDQSLWSRSYSGCSRLAMSTH